MTASCCSIAPQALNIRCRRSRVRSIVTNRLTTRISSQRFPGRCSRRNEMRRGLWAALMALLSFGSAAHADKYPSHPVTIVVPFAAGGPSDAMARILSERMKVSLGEAVLVENVTGAGGSIGVGRAVRSPPDGYTVSFGHLGTHVCNGAIYRLGYDLVDDLEPVVLLPSNPMIIVSKTAVPAKSLTELLAWLKARPSLATAGTAGAGSGSHVAGLYFDSVTGLKLQYVP